MTNDILIKELRWNADVYKGYTMDDEDKQMMRDAADAIKELFKERDKYKELWRDEVQT